MVTKGEGSLQKRETQAPVEKQNPLGKQTYRPETSSHISRLVLISVQKGCFCIAAIHLFLARVKPAQNRKDHAVTHITTVTPTLLC